MQASDARTRRVLLALTGLALTATALFDVRTVTAAAPPEATTRVLSCSAAGLQGTEASGYPSISADGRFVLFASEAPNLIGGDTNGEADIFVADTASGTLVCASRTPGGGPAQGSSWAASINADGTKVAFCSSAPDLVSGDTNEQPDVFVRDLSAGTTVRIGPASGQSDGASSAPRLSADGRFVAFTSDATNLVAGDSNGASDVFVCELGTGVIERASTGVSGAAADGASEGAAISADGRFVVFASQARNLISGEAPEQFSPCWNVYRRDRQSGTTARVSINLTGERGSGASFAPAISADGRWVAFASNAPDLVSSDLDGKPDVFVRDMDGTTVQRISVGLGGLEPTGDSGRPSISGDGRFIAFESAATNLVSGFVPSGSTWCYVRDRVAGTTCAVAAPSPEPGPAGGSVSPAISADGRWVSFSSADTALAGGANGQEQVFVRGPLQ